MVVSQSKLKKVIWTVNETAGGSAVITGLLKISGKMTEALAKILSCHASAYKDRLPEFQVSRESDKVSLGFYVTDPSSDDGPKKLEDLLPETRRLWIPKASLHRYTCRRSEAGVIDVEMAAAVPFDQLENVGQFLSLNAGGIFDLSIEPEQGELFEEV